MPTRTGRKSSSKREAMSPRGDRRFVRRGAKGRFKESDDAGRASRSDRRQRAQRTVKKGQGDRGDQKQS